MGCPVETGDVDVEVMLKSINGEVAKFAVLDTPSMGDAAIGMDGEFEPAVAEGQGSEMFGVFHLQLVGLTNNLLHTQAQESVTVLNV